ncbi:tubulin-specific chaperone cofactor E-like protein [Condylostylus longicornis]|uniref:tubulin-specific chaperone cofactor E-like protein n=1 Tax=Condylostylus longicornis TaxID=2530218 RepID=UPI00244DB53F|nr:tubulin-specific chaperone cofactor E-like protein [Condylostylus longicornis]
MPSLLEAIEEKYGVGCCDFSGPPDPQEQLVSIFVPKLPPLVSVPQLLVLNDCDIDCAGSEEDLKKKCHTVRELDLAQNKLANWNEVFRILEHMPRIEFVNLSKNLLNGPVIAPPQTTCLKQLKSLVLNNTRLDWESVESLLKYVPALQELHLSLNDYRNVLIDTIDDDYCGMMITSDLDDLTLGDDDDDKPEELCQCKLIKTHQYQQQQQRLNNGNENNIINSDTILNSNTLCCNGTNKISGTELIPIGASTTTAGITRTDIQNIETTISKMTELKLPSATHVKDNSVASSYPGSSSMIACDKHNNVESYKRSDSTSSMYKKTEAHSGVRKLHFTGNPVQDWSEICRLGRVFPNLDTLVLANCPLKAVEAVPRPPSSNSDKSSNTTDDEDVAPPHEFFKNLAFLNLSSTKINTWDDVDRLAQFPNLKNLRVQNWPLWDKCDSTEYERRQLLIARLPYVQTLNGGVVTTEEREDAERAFIRYYMDKPESDRPARYNELIAKHGKLDPLVNIDLRPEKRVKITFTYGDICEVRSCDVYRTVIDLKMRLERIVGIPHNKMRLYYVDQDLRDHQGPEEMKYPHKRLYSYNIQSGDEIIIDQKR